ncbi:MAG: MarR family transcriptional regulator [Acidobacteria bacterium]|nr:MarR family transcriptional regulator [Acidobacteriota bacterium]
MNGQPGETRIAAPLVGPAFLVSQVGAHAAVCFGERLEALELIPQHAGILRMLGSNPGMSQQALSETLGMFPSRLVSLLDELERRKLIERRGSPRDRRVYQLHLTGEGRKSLTAVGKVTRQLEEDLFSALSESELATIQDLLARIAAQQRITPGVHPAYRQTRKQKTSKSR